jgi:hypothetical protein
VTSIPVFIHTYTPPINELKQKNKEKIIISKEKDKHLSSHAHHHQP